MTVLSLLDAEHYNIPVPRRIIIKINIAISLRFHGEEVLRTKGKTSPKTIHLRKKKKTFYELSTIAVPGKEQHLKSSTLIEPIYI